MVGFTTMPAKMITYFFFLWRPFLPIKYKLPEPFFSLVAYFWILNLVIITWPVVFPWEPNFWIC